MNELAVRAAWSLPKVIWWKIKYGGRFRAPLVQSFGKHTELHLDKKAKVSLGKETVSRFGLFLRAEGGTLSIGDKCFFNTHVSVTCMERIRIGDRCQIANNVVIVDHDHDYRKGWGSYRTAPVEIGDDVWIGANAVILKGSRIGSGSRKLPEDQIIDGLPGIVRQPPVILQEAALGRRQGGPVTAAGNVLIEEVGVHGKYLKEAVKDRFLGMADAAFIVGHSSLGHPKKGGQLLLCIAVGQSCLSDPLSDPHVLLPGLPFREGPFPLFI